MKGLSLGVRRVQESLIVTQKVKNDEKKKNKTTVLVWKFVVSTFIFCYSNCVMITRRKKLPSLVFPAKTVLMATKILESTASRETTIL